MIVGGSDRINRNLGARAATPTGGCVEHDEHVRSVSRIDGVVALQNSVGTTVTVDVAKRQVRRARRVGAAKKVDGLMLPPPPLR